MTRVVQDLASVDWKRRQEGLRGLEEAAGSRLRDVKNNIVGVMDALLPRLSDVNSKVNTYAHNVLKELVTRLGSDLEPFLPRIVPSVINALCSSNPVVRAAAQVGADAVFSDMEGGSTLPLVSNMALHGNSRTCVVSLQWIEKIMMSGSVSQKQTVVTKHVLPVCASYIADNKVDVRSAIRRILVQARGILGSEGLLDSTRGWSEPDKLRMRELLAAP